MSKTKQRFFEFINSEDYSNYYINGNLNQQQELIKTAYKRFSDAEATQVSINLRKRLQQRFNKK